MKSLFVLLVSLHLSAAFSDNPLSSSGWTPVVGSKLVNLPHGYIEEPQRPVKIEQQKVVEPPPNESRIGVVQESVQSLEQNKKEGTIVREEEIQTALSLSSSNENNIQSPVHQPAKPPANDVAPFIIYPEGTFTTRSTQRTTQSTTSSKPILSQPEPPVITAHPPHHPRLPIRPRQRPPPPLAVPNRSREAPPPPLLNSPRSRPPPPLRRRPPPPPPHHHRGPPPKKGISLPGAGIGSSISCFTEDVAADYRLSDKNYMQAQIKCVLNEGPCDKVGGAIKRLAPEIFRGRCPHPCNPCKKKQIQKIMARVSKEYPYEWTQMIKIFG